MPITYIVEISERHFEPVDKNGTYTGHRRVRFDSTDYASNWDILWVGSVHFWIYGQLADRWVKLSYLLE